MTDHEKWDIDQYVDPIISQLTSTRGTLNHRITNKNRWKKYVDDIYISYFAGYMKYEDPLYGVHEVENSNFWFEQRWGDALSVKSIIEIENTIYEFAPGTVFGTFSNEIDIMILNLKFHEIKSQSILVDTEMCFTNRDKSFSGTFSDHACKSVCLSTELFIEPLHYLDYHNWITKPNRLKKHLSEQIYDITQIHEYDCGWEERNMKSYKIGIK